MLAKVASANTGGHTNYVALIYEVSNVNESPALKDTHGHNTNSSLHKVGGCVNYFPMPAWKIFIEMIIGPHYREIVHSCIVFF